MNRYASRIANPARRPPATLPAATLPRAARAHESDGMGAMR